MRALLIEDTDGSLVDVLYACSAWCEREWYAARGEDHPGDYLCDDDNHLAWCAVCGIRVSTGYEYEDASECEWTCVPSLPPMAFGGYVSAFVSVLPDDRARLASVLVGALIGDERCPHGLPAYIAPAAIPDRQRAADMERLTLAGMIPPRDHATTR